jgi:hypothetical protein
MDCLTSATYMCHVVMGAKVPATPGNNVSFIGNEEGRQFLSPHTDQKRSNMHLSDAVILYLMVLIILEM